MKQKLSILIGGLIAFCLPLPASAQNVPSSLASQGDFGSKVKMSPITEVLVTNFQGQPLGRIQDLLLDLTNGRIAGILVVYDQTFRMGGKSVVVPPLALICDTANKVYKLNISVEKFKSAPSFDMSEPAAYTSTDRMAAAYNYFGQRPYFLITGEADRDTASGTAVAKLGIIEKMSRIINIQVNSLQGLRLGRVQSLMLDVPSGRILNVFLQMTAIDASEKTRQYSTVIPPELLSFNAARDQLVLDTTQAGYNDDAHVVFAYGAGRQIISYRIQPAMDDPNTPDDALVQGTSNGDIKTTAQVYKSILTSDLDPRNEVVVITLDGRITLRGTVNSQTMKDKIGALASTAVNADHVNNELTVMAPSQASL